MHPGIRQSGKCRVKYHAAPHTWRNDSAELHKHDTAMLWTTMRQQASCTQVCIESEGHIETCQNTMKTVVPFKKLWNSYTISIRGMVSSLLTCVLLAQVHIDSLILHTYTAMYVYICTTADIDLHRCSHMHIQVPQWCVNILTCKRECTYVYECAHCST